MVFQHIPSREIIENYAREVHRLLRPGALFKFQVQGCANMAHEARNSWVGVSFTEEEARRMAERCGFVVSDLRYVQSSPQFVRMLPLLVPEMVLISALRARFLERGRPCLLATLERRADA